MRQFHVHLVSDSTGETVSSVSRAALVQFDGIEPVEHVWSLVRTKGQMERVIESIDESPGMVLYTIVDKSLRDLLKAECLKRNIPCIPVLKTVVAEMAAYLGIQTSALPGKQHELNEEYFSRVEAINFALTHDDGQSTWDIGEADIVIVGVSRTSKSPTCIYLANRGYKAANIPFVTDCPLPETLFSLDKTFVVGLTISTDRLIQIRKTRLQSLHEDKDTNYVEIDKVEQEILDSRRLFKQHGWPVIDVTRRSVEETAATIMQYFHKHLEKRISDEQ